MIKIKIKNIIEFYDEHKDENMGSHVSSITGLIGEDLAAGLFKHYFENEHGKKCIIIDSSPTEGKKGGKWLDRWIQVKNDQDDNYTFYQTEIKNWSSHSIGGKTISLNAEIKEYNSYAKAAFDSQWDYDNQILKNDNVLKVLKRMKKIDLIQDGDIIKPLVCYWLPLYYKELDEFDTIPASFELDCNRSYSQFESLTFFSMSTYLRKLKKANLAEIEIEAPNIEKRMMYIHSLIG